MNEINTNGHDKAIAALVIGICSCAFCLTGAGSIIGIILGIIGIILANKASNAGNNETINKAGRILSIVGLSVSGAVFLIVIAFVACAAVVTPLAII